jgi:methylated-DNA-[protein]-cysteine S-methyltransferase
MTARSAQGGTHDAHVERRRQAGDPLPAGPALAAELAATLARTRTAVRASTPQRSVAGAARDSAPLRRRPVIRDGRPVAAFSRLPAPWWHLHVAVGERGLLAIELASETDDFVAQLAWRLGGAVVPVGPGTPAPWRATLSAAGHQLEEYFAGRRLAFSLPLDLRASPWDRLVLDAARRVSYGTVTSYGALARSIGRPRAARAVGGALGRNPIPLVIPCHRIVAADARLGGYGGRQGTRDRMLDVKRSLLALEGVRLAG